MLSGYPINMHRYRLDKHKVLIFSDDARKELTKVCKMGLPLSELRSILIQWLKNRPEDIKLVSDLPPSEHGPVN